MTPRHTLLLLLLLLAGCGAAAPRARPVHPIQVLHIAAIVPESGIDAPLGQAILRGVQLALHRLSRPARYKRIALTPIDEVTLSPARLRATLQRDHVLAVIGPFDSKRSLRVFPVVNALGIATLGPPALTTAVPGTGLPDIFHLSPGNETLGRVAADTALSSGPGLGAHTIFLTDDGSAWARAVTSAATAELTVRGAGIAGRRSLHPAILDDIQSAVNAIIDTAPDLVLYAGGTDAGAGLRRTLSLTGVPHLPLLTAGPIADHPAWSTVAGGRLPAMYTLALLPARPVASIPRARRFLTLYRQEFPRTTPLPQTALAYDAAMDALGVMTTLLHAHRPVTRRAVRTGLASTRYTGVTGALSFDRAGRDLSPLPITLYIDGPRGWYPTRTTIVP